MEKVSSGPLKSSSTGSKESWDIALNWFSDCVENHDLCASRTTHWYPTRLIDVGKSDQIRLIVTKEMASLSGGYVALSHCWGTSPIIRLTKDVLETFKNSIPIHQLPKTFVDAIEITRHLRARYLWIDSLCIIVGLHSEIRSNFS